jgi:hypothetical protein
MGDNPAGGRPARVPGIPGEGEWRMKRSELARAADPEAVVERVAELAPGLQQQGHEHGHGHAGAMETTREATYRGHHIVIRTTYQIEVDGKPLTGHMGVSDDGQVHYHAVPNIGFASAVDMVKQLVDTFPDDFDGQEGTHSHGGRS